MHFEVMIDVANQDLFVALFSLEHKVIDFTHIKRLQKRTEVLPKTLRDLISKHNLTITNCEAFYVTNGPGSFTGARSGLVFVRTISQITGASLFVGNTFALAKEPLTTCCIDGGGEDKYQVTFTQHNGLDITITKDAACKACIISYEDIVANFPLYLKRFTRIINPVDALPIYLKNPTIGHKE